MDARRLATLAQKANELETRMQSRPGFAETAALRETFGFVLAKIHLAGMSWDDIDGYIAESIALMRESEDG